MHSRSQRTIARAVEVQGVGFLTGADVRLRFLPAPPHHGVTFRRTDRIDSAPIPALVEFTVPRQRRTAIEHRGVAVEMIEHVMAALAGLHIDNCRVELNAPEPPGCDGSSRTFADVLWNSGIIDQGTPRAAIILDTDVSLIGRDGKQALRAQPNPPADLFLSYTLDYGPRSPIPAQQFSAGICPETFLNEIAFARTFILEHEAAALQAQGYGRRTTPRDLLIFGSHGVIDNELRCPDECARHKLLDCIGDFALLGCDLYGCVEAYRSGHQLNAELVRQVKLQHPVIQPFSTTARRCAA